MCDALLVALSPIALLRHAICWATALVLNLSHALTISTPVLVRPTDARSCFTLKISSPSSGWRRHEDASRRTNHARRKAQSASTLRSIADAWLTDAVFIPLVIFSHYHRPLLRGEIPVTLSVVHHRRCSFLLNATPMLALTCSCAVTECAVTTPRTAWRKIFSTRLAPRSYAPSSYASLSAPYNFASSAPIGNSRSHRAIFYYAASQ